MVRVLPVPQPVIQLFLLTSELLISTLSVLGREVWLDSGGSYYAYHYGLNFRNDSIFSNYMSGGLGCGSYISHVGVKISDTP
jgi:hypothetical protein